MLRLLKIKNFALISDETIEFNDGFNVIIGETGAGKSLIIDAISFVLGEKSNKLNIRTGEEKMSVQAVFEINSKAVNEFLNSYDIDLSDCLILSRTLHLDGRSDVRINGTIVNVGTLKELSKLIIDVYAQNENVELLNVKNHLPILDLYGSDFVLDLKNQIDLLRDDLKSLENKMEEFGTNGELRERKLELLDYQIKEIENAELSVGEDEELKSKIDKLSNYEKIFENVKQSCDGLSKTNEILSSIKSNISLASKYDETLNNLLERIKGNQIDLLDILEELQNYGDESFDESELDRLANRLDLINSLKKKYGSSIDEIFVFLGKIKEEYDNLLFGEEKLKALKKQYDLQKKNIYELCLKLSSIRKELAVKIEKSVFDELTYLGFKNFKFSIAFSQLPKLEDAIFTKNGLDNVEFLFSANAGESQKSLAKTISGGEMSRFMLAIKNVFARSYNSSTIIFDEVDSGISGEIGLKVAKRLATLSKQSQIICITHLAQVTAMADNYIFVKKEVVNGKTYSVATTINEVDSIKYIAEISGAEPTDVAIQFAKELKQKANEFKNNI